MKACCEKLMTSKSLFIKVYRDVKGTTTIEYGLILMCVFLAIIAAVKGVADENTGMWALVASKSAEAHGGTP
jgi:Flp pilus assembly pilin Flp